MLSAEERQQLAALARCRQLREDFALVKRVARRRAPACTLDEYLAFLDFLRQIQAYQPAARSFPIYVNIRL